MQANTSHQRSSTAHARSCTEVIRESSTVRSGVGVEVFISDPFFTDVDHVTGLDGERAGLSIRHRVPTELESNRLTIAYPLDGDLGRRTDSRKAACQANRLKQREAAAYRDLIGPGALDLTQNGEQALGIFHHNKRDPRVDA